VRVKESQEPNLFAGIIANGVRPHTLLLASRLSDDFRFSDNDIRLFTVRRNSTNFIVTRIRMIQSFQRPTAQSVQLLIRWSCSTFGKTSKNTLILGGRYQHEKRFRTSHGQRVNVRPRLPTNMHPETTLRRGVLYAYDDYEVSTRSG